MDVEKTIEFLLNNQAGHDERLARIETTVDKLTVDVASLTVSVEALTGNVEALTGKVDALTENGAALHESVRVLAVTVDKMTDSILVVNRQTEARDERLQREFAERDERRSQEFAERDRQLGGRIDQLASAIGEFVRNRPAAG